MTALKLGNLHFLGYSLDVVGGEAVKVKPVTLHTQKVKNENFLNKGYFNIPSLTNK